MPEEGCIGFLRLARKNLLQLGNGRTREKSNVREKIAQVLVDKDERSFFRESANAQNHSRKIRW
jgi:hypothetical protein